MIKTLKFELKNFSCVPYSLRTSSSASTPVAEVSVRMADLFNHLYQDSFQEFIPTLNPLSALYTPLFSGQRELRLSGGGLGTHKEVKVGEYNKFGKAFCRWFLHEHCDMAFFAHMDHVLDKSFIPGYGVRLERVDEGDTPDYFCARSSRKIYLAEAKGSSSPIKFSHKKFTSWREQFGRVTVVDGTGRNYWLKGYIVATYLACEKDRPAVRSILLAEDPRSAGDAPMDNSPDFTAGLGEMVISNHYASIMEKLRQPLMAVALRHRLTMGDDVRVSYAIWRCLVPPAQEVEYVGGYFPSHHLPFNTTSDLLGIWDRNIPVVPPLNLAAEKHVFFGLELEKFKALEEVVRKGFTSPDRINPSGVTIKRNEAPPDMSMLLDGSVMAPLDYFVLSGYRTAWL